MLPYARATAVLRPYQFKSILNHIISDCSSISINVKVGTQNENDLIEWMSYLSMKQRKHGFHYDKVAESDGTVSYTHLTLPTNREV